jgi:hypothetical protein
MYIYNFLGDLLYLSTMLELVVCQQRAQVLAQFIIISLSFFVDFYCAYIIDPFVNIVRFPRAYSFC